MKLENFTDLQTWAVEQWEDAKLGDSRRTDRAIAIGAAIASCQPASEFTKPDGTKGYLKAFARSLEPMAAKTIVTR